MTINKIYLGAIFLLLSSVSNAALVTFNYTGTITSHRYLSSDLHTLIPIGQTFSGSYMFDTSFPASSSSNPNDLSYIGAISSYTVSVGSLFAELDNGALRLINDRENTPLPSETEPTFFDTYIVQGRTDHFALPTNVDTNIVLSNYQSDTVDSGWHVRWLRIDVTDPLAVLLNDAALHATPPDIAGLHMSFQFGFVLDCCTGRTEVHGVIDSLSVASVPLPPAILLFSSGLLMFIPGLRVKRNTPE